MACFRRTHRRSGWTSLNSNAIKPELRALSSTTRNPRSSDQPEADFNDIHVSPAFRMPIGMAWHTPADVATELPGLRVQEREPTYLYIGYGNNSFRVEIDAMVLSFCLSAPVWPVLARACCLARGGKLISSDMLWPFCNDFCYDLCMLHAIVLKCIFSTYPVVYTQWEYCCLRFREVRKIMKQIKKIRK